MEVNKQNYKLEEKKIYLFQGEKVLLINYGENVSIVKKDSGGTQFEVSTKKLVDPYVIVLEKNSFEISTQGLLFSEN